MEPVDTTKGLKYLRELIVENGVDIFIVPSEDELYSKYIAAYEKFPPFPLRLHGLC
jgi:hypothetical protein